jgi:hypothetical protein
VRVRFGLALFIVSWLPIAQFVIWGAGLHGDTAQKLRAAIWAVQWAIGFIGLLIAGRVVAGVVKHSGWRRTPALVWQMLKTGRIPDQAQAPQAGSGAA